MLSADKVLNHALVKPIEQAIQGKFLSSALGKLGLGGKKISYLPSRTFSAAVFDLLAPADPADPAHPGAAAVSDPMARARAAVDGMSEHNPARKPLLRMMTDAQGDRDKFRTSLEHWYD